MVEEEKIYFQLRAVEDYASVGPAKTDARVRKDPVDGNRERTALRTVFTKNGVANPGSGHLGLLHRHNPVGRNTKHVTIYHADILGDDSVTAFPIFYLINFPEISIDQSKQYIATASTNQQPWVFKDDS